MKTNYWFAFHATTTSLVFIPMFAASISEASATPSLSSVTALRVSDFLDSIGTLSAISVRGEKLEKTAECCQYLGVRWLRAGIEGNVPIEQFVKLHEQGGLRFSWGLGSGSTDLAKLIATGKQIEAAGALLAFEGPMNQTTGVLSIKAKLEVEINRGCRWQSCNVIFTRQ